MLGFAPQNLVDSRNGRRRFFRVLHLSLRFWLAALALCGWSARADVLVGTNSIWHYFKGTAEASDPTNAWREIAFDDSAWLVGPAPFHYGSNPMCGGGDEVVVGGVTNCAVGGTILSDMRSNYTCIFLRQKFVVADTGAVATLNFGVSLDDGAAFWINGKLARSTITVVGNTNFAYTNIASTAREASVFNRQDISAAIGSLVNGTNVLCVQAFNVNLTNDDFRIDVELVSSDLRPFPLAANQRGMVTCLETPAIGYDAYLPPTYASEGDPLPILYTMNPNGGGMVGDFRAVCSNLNMIVIGVTGACNCTTWETHLREFFAVSRDVRQRVRFDPTAEFAGGFSGGGESAYVFSRFRAQHVAGLFEMAGWLGRSLGYYSTDRVQTNLLVARATGTTDTAANFYILRDSNVLASAGAVIRDWYFSGGHSVAPDSLKSAGLSWLLSQRVPAGQSDRSNSAARATDWRARLASGQREPVLRECVRVLMDKPRTWDAYQAQLMMDRLAADEATFRAMDVTGLAEGDFASDLFYYYGRSAALAGDFSRYRSSLKALTGVTGANGDRAGDLRALLLQFGHPAPVLQWSADQSLGQMNLWLIKATPGLDYFLQVQTNFVDGVWQDVPLPTVENNTRWSSDLLLQTEMEGGFYRMRVTPSAGSSPPWPP
jgi:hypothetical protein